MHVVNVSLKFQVHRPYFKFLMTSLQTKNKWAICNAIELKPEIVLYSFDQLTRCFEKLKKTQYSAGNFDLENADKRRG